MLAYDEKGELKEFEKVKDIVVCPSCQMLFRQRLTKQVLGMREWEYDECPHCYKKLSKSMTYYYNNTKLSDQEVSKMKRTSLLEEVTEYCNEEFKNRKCENCNSDENCVDECEGYCKGCLEQVHYPNKYPDGKKDYDCVRMLQFYVCDYSYKYTSELLYLMRESEALRQIDDYRVVSIGCGGCPDLMAFEKYCHEKGGYKSVRYYGIDVNEKWSSIHGIIKDYKTSTLRSAKFKYMDAVTEDYHEIERANVIVLQYIISHFYNTGQISEINEFFDKLVEKIIKYGQEGKPFVILINDVNSNRRGRDYFKIIIEKLNRIKSRIINSERYYFDYNIQNDSQRYGTKHESNDILFEIPTKFDYYQPWKKCSSAQLLIEVL